MNLLNEHIDKYIDGLNESLEAEAYEKFHEESQDIAKSEYAKRIMETNKDLEDKIAINKKELNRVALSKAIASEEDRKMKEQNETGIGTEKRTSPPDPTKLSEEELKKYGYVDLGKYYRAVKNRLQDFRKWAVYNDWTIETEVTHASPNLLTVITKTTIKDKQGRVRSTGIASETKGVGSFANTTSHVQNCETSSLGRALTMLDPYLMGDELASADELAKAITETDAYEIKADIYCEIINDVSSLEDLKTLWESKKSEWQALGGTLFQKLIKAKDEKKKELEK